MSGIRRRMTLPSVQGREDPIYKAPTKPASDPGHSAAFIFVHGLGDDAAGLENVADQFQNNNKLPHMNWIIPNAKENRDSMQKAWYRPTPLTPFPSSRPELDEEEDEQGLMETVKYLESLIDACVNKGVPPNRIVLGGFSQGCAVSLLTDLVSAKYAGRLAGIVGLMGYLPLAENYRLQDIRAHYSLPPTHGDVPVFLARGKKDILIPTRIWNRSLKGLEAVGLSKDSLEVHEYENTGHTITGPLLRDMCAFLERAVPALEE
ncbi:alpha/beta-hydrolase [Teratosphaeria nubilosa]|uniref:Acyl-protein thioesterase 1 n=1 Tax=Teratosphaeria nubilosa TaxID=161662 RepID=A0A6G1L9T7_9PEZI|nr:alpha/beta-hydrolase [Teratosphaeria nubilosa]